MQLQSKQTPDCANSWQDPPVGIVMAAAAELSSGSLTGGHLVVVDIREEGVRLCGGTDAPVYSKYDIMTYLVQYGCRL